MSAVCSPNPRRTTHLDSTLTCDQLAEGFSYDPASQVTAISHQLTALSQQINKADYVYNGVGNRTSLTDRRGAQTFGYDSLDRLTSASHPLLGTPQAFAYDAVGNRTTTGNVTNAGNQLTADATHAYQYDDNGNLTRKTLLGDKKRGQATFQAGIAVDGHGGATWTPARAGPQCDVATGGTQTVADDSHRCGAW